MTNLILLLDLQYRWKGTESVPFHKLKTPASVRVRTQVLSRQNLRSEVTMQNAGAPLREPRGAVAPTSQRPPRLKIAMIGTRGVPAHYGGFETAVEEVGARLVDRGHQVVVYCRGAETRASTHRGMQLVHLPALRAKQLETLSHTFASTVHQMSMPTSGRSVALVFNAANAPFVPLLRRRGIPTIVHVDGLEWKRAKWGRLGRHYYLASERLAVRTADALIADAQAIQDYYRETYGASSEFIPYGAPVPDPAPMESLRELYGVDRRGYYLVVARMEPENHVLEIVRGYLGVPGGLPLLVVGSAPYANAYQVQVEGAAARDPRVRLLGSVWDQRLLDALYTHCAGYIHGHSVGGTNPSLLRAMGAGAPVVAVDVVFNREVLGETATYFGLPQFSGSEALPQFSGSEARWPSPDLISAEMGLRGQQRARALYDWDAVALQYEQLCLKVRGGSGRQRVSDRSADLAQSPSRSGASRR